VPREHLRVIHDQADRAGRIVRNLLTFARKGVTEKAPVDLNDVAARTAMLIVYELQLHGIELEQALSPEPWSSWATGTSSSRCFSTCLPTRSRR
jgi:Signal transduction histidine kinase regulating C4-dicarboxylate transport system